jgi:hypothetical protein
MASSVAWRLDIFPQTFAYEMVRTTWHFLSPSLTYAPCSSCLCERAGVSRRSRLLELLDERDVVTLQQDLADLAPLLWRVLLGEGDFDGVVDNEVHKFVETLCKH